MSCHLSATDVIAIDIMQENGIKSDWPWFEDAKWVLFNDSKYESYLKIHSMDFVAFGAERRLIIDCLEQSLKNLNASIESLKPIFANPEDSQWRRDVSEAAKFKTALEQIASELFKKIEHENRFNDSEMPKFKGHSGRPPKYPPLISQWIYEVIEKAKNDGEKLDILYNFFVPESEFDKWLKEKTKGKMGGPRWEPKQDGHEISNLEKWNWLNAIKSNHLQNVITFEKKLRQGF